ncbi:Acyl carrier protein phosphodiesterase [Dyella sp. OK004]|uniref:acyl carrier protein phosphodiesterase n=1 Tax=Dyella sp. OK004 TaxID=1855292 RepID=UPI0008F1C660|nr:ACP phosphodiesterase [Dyella sp. OK004]SFS17194.1 Acyl carrier protein phosphodiesterase [Dyella sp. OK004]
MNHLAHALLSGDDDWLRLGGMMGDFVHGQPDPAQLPARVIDGIRLHRAIDVFTDSHPEVLAAKALLPAPYRRYGGILIDMWFDHALARDFGRWSGQPLERFSGELRELLHRHDALLPPMLRRFRSYMDAHNLPAGYAEVGEMDLAFHGLSSRLKRENPVDTAVPLLMAHDAPLQAHFEAFFPQLQGFAADWIAQHGAAPSVS